jgi:hypothetical protein
MNKILVLIVILCVNLSCESSLSKSEKQFLKENNIKKEKYENLYFTNENICKEKGLPTTQFAIEYPNSLKATFPKDNKTHIQLEKISDGKISEFLSIGNSTVTLNNEKMTLQLLEMLASGFKQMAPGLVINRMGKYKFKGEMTYLFEGTVDFSNFKNEKFDGVYKIIQIISLPKKNKNLNSVSVNFTIRQNSDFENLSDFENNSLISKVWDTFRYIE